ncbi:Eukaryotic aspartyl protease family protein isoform 1 [Tripterygium wilfordii]|uniref:Eukaryotic aspartyl protease family protein isoform 1 n=1 Tax=Tripterygium wilfordii TaxID=458696 RepID=A0A7J7E348_TRIWF|nr:Eukaryotic aspartyl protease family protein isoform 1 [Tripterygium wilfordii]
MTNPHPLDQKRLRAPGGRPGRAVLRAGPVRCSKLSDLESPLDFYDGNSTFLISSLGFGEQVQSGSFLDIGAPNGLFALGKEKISVPSILSREDLMADSLPMSFGHDGIRRINFGDKGSSDQEETPFNAESTTLDQIQVGTTLIDMNLTAPFESGTSFAYLVDPTYTSLVENVSAQNDRDRRGAPDSSIPFEYCYNMSSILPSAVAAGLGRV